MDVLSILSSIADDLNENDEYGLILIKDTENEVQNLISKEIFIKNNFAVIPWRTASDTSEAIREKIRNNNNGSKLILLVNDVQTQSLSLYFPSFYNQQLFKDETGIYRKHRIFILEKMGNTWQNNKY